MKTITIEIEDYSPTTGLRYNFEGGGMIKIVRYGDAFVIEGDHTGFRDLAAALLTLAHSEAPPHAHLHLDSGFGFFRSGASDLIVQFAK